MELGWLTLLPPIVIIVVAMTTKKTTSSLLIGVLLCCALKYGKGLIDPFIALIYRVGTSEDTVWIIAFTALFGCFIQWPVWCFCGYLLTLGHGRLKS